MSNLLGPRDENGIPVPMTVDESIASMKASLLKKIKRSAYVYRVDCGGCNGCEIEIFATLSPLFDAERFRDQSGAVAAPCRYSAVYRGGDPRDAFSGAARLAVGAGSENLYLLRRLRQQRRHLPRPLLRLGRHRQNRAGGRLYSGLPADACRHAVRLRDGAGLLEQKIHARLPGEQDDKGPSFCTRHGAAAAGAHRPRSASPGGLSLWRQIADDYMRLLAQGDSQVVRWLEAEKDPRLTEIVTHLNQVVEGARIR
jgi:formate hydrogenlyase subunit 7